VLVFGLPLIWLVVFPLAALSFGELEGDWEATMINYLCCFGSFLAHVMNRIYLSYPDLTWLRGGRDGSHKIDQHPATGTATSGPSRPGCTDGPPGPRPPMAGPGETPHHRSTPVGSNPRSRLFLGSAAEAGGYQIAGPRAEGLACQRPFWRQAKGG
jgi:hypothetical protein